jgi:G3E family GTPase
MAVTPSPLKKQRLDVAALLAPPAPAAPLEDDAVPALLTADRTWAAAKNITSQMRTGAVPLTILTGFLGAGKSTILNYILKAPHKLRIAVLINEFGDIDIDSKLVDTSTSFQDGDPVVLDNGCICCTVSNGFIDAITRILSTSADIGSRPDYIIVETTGLANPKPIVDSIQETELRDEVYVDQVLAAVDSSIWTGEHYNSPTAKRQIENADTVLLTKTDLVQDETSLSAVIDSIISIRPNARIIRSQAGYVPIGALFDLDSLHAGEESNMTGPDSAVGGKLDQTEGIQSEKSHDATSIRAGTSGLTDGGARIGPCNDIRAKEVETGHVNTHSDHNGRTTELNGNYTACEEEHGCRSCHEHEPGKPCNHDHGSQSKNSHFEEEGFSSISFVSHQPLSLSRFRQDFMEGLPAGVFRAKGLLWFQNYPSRFIFHWSGSRYNVDEGDWPTGVEKMNQLVVIGRNIDHSAITSLLNSCIVQPGQDGESVEESDQDGDGYQNVGEGEQPDDS